jgi:hypothetical protein
MVVKQITEGKNKYYESDGKKASKPVHTLYRLVEMAKALIQHS